MTEGRPLAIIDIGSNSVRLVVYSGATRSPSIVFNEKVMAGLGRRMAGNGMLSEEAQERALAALARFRLLIDRMVVGRTRIVATAAVREAANGAAFLDRVRGLGFEPELVSGDEESRLAGLGVIAAIPEADGIVGDLGGGSLELAEVKGGEVLRRCSLRLGVLRLAELARDGDGAIIDRAREAIAKTDFEGAARGRTFYMVGGSWRALARFDMALTGHPLPVTHQHSMPPVRPAQLTDMIQQLDKEVARDIPNLSVSRVPTLPHANALLRAIVDSLDPARLVASSYGIREGLLYDALDPAVQRLDPLIEAAREAGAGLGRFAQHGELLDAWIAPVFDDPPAAARLRLAACMLADIAWAAHPEFRAERGVDMALHGNWVAIDGPGRVMLAQALFSNFGGGDGLPYPHIADLCAGEDLRQAALWGLAMRLAQRLSGGVGTALERSRLSVVGDALRLDIRAGEEALYGEPVERRLKTLASALGLRPETVIRS